MNDTLFKLFILTLSMVLLVVVLIILIETIRHKPAGRIDKLTHLRSYQNGYALSDSADLYRAQRVLYIQSDRIEYSESGINGKFREVWHL